MFRVLVAPRDALAGAIAEPRGAVRATALLVTVTALGALTLPRQLPALAEALLGPGGPPYGPLMLAGLRRLIVLDRVMPPLTPVVAAVLVYFLAGAWLPAAPARSRVLVAAITLGLSPLILLRLGELLTVWLVPAAGLTAGDIVALPRWFATGPITLLARDAVSPALDLLDARLNLVTAWILTLWVLALRRLDGEAAAWQILVPLLAYLIAGALTWVLGMPTMALLLGGP